MVDAKHYELYASTDPKLARGEMPENFAKVCADAVQMHRIASLLFTRHPGESDLEMNARMRDIFLICAHSLAATRHRITDGEEAPVANPLAFIERARQIVDWCCGAPTPPTTVEVFQSQAREIARATAERLFDGEGFLTILFEQKKGERTFAHDGLFTFATTIGLDQIVALAERAAGVLKSATPKEEPAS